MATGSQIDEAGEQLQRKKDPNAMVSDTTGRLEIRWRRSIKKQYMVDTGVEGGWMEGLTARAPDRLLSMRDRTVHYDIASTRCSDLIHDLGPLYVAHVTNERSLLPQLGSGRCRYVELVDPYTSEARNTRQSRLNETCRTRFQIVK